MLVEEYNYKIIKNTTEYSVVIAKINDLHSAYLLFDAIKNDNGTHFFKTKSIDLICNFDNEIIESIKL